MIKRLYNKKSKKELVKDLNAESFERITCSFYSYTQIENVDKLRDEIYIFLDSFKIFGRVYIAFEGINAQLSVPEHKWDDFKKEIKQFDILLSIPIKKAILDGVSFYKLIVKIKKEIVAYGMPEKAYDMNNVGKYLDAQEFNLAMEDDNSIVMDMRNFYETEVGKFENAEIPLVEKSKDLLPEVRKMLVGREKRQVLLYCTGGIRCEKASSFLIKNGIKNVKQLQGGIIQYAHEIKRKDIKSKFIGKNFVFDARLGERVTDDIISTCHLCGEISDNHKDCNNDACHILFIQCSECDKNLNGCCSEECKEIKSLPLDKQKVLRKDPKRVVKKRYYRSP